MNLIPPKSQTEETNQFGSSNVTFVLAGRQNAGKTSLLMHITRSSQQPVNFPGSSVERIESSLSVGGKTLRGIDLPGIGSMEPISPEENVALSFLRETSASEGHVLCAVVDATKLSIELRLLSGLFRLGLPTIVVVTKIDVAEREGKVTRIRELERLLAVPVISVNALTGEGCGKLRDLLLDSSALSKPSFTDLDAEKLTQEVQVAPSQRKITLTDRLDSIFLHSWLGLPVVALLLFGMFQLLYIGAEPFIGWIEELQAVLASSVADAVEAGALQSLLVDGLINGVGSIVVFLPQIVLLVTFVSVLEASGYMARAAFLLDRLLGRVGLSGRSFVPLVSSFACAVPAILSARIIDNERDRLATIAVAPLMSCSARLPVYVLLIGAFFPLSLAGIVLFGLYAMGIVIAALVAYTLRKTVLRGDVSVLMMELPPYQRPSFRVVYYQVRGAVESFLVLAGTVIFTAAVLIWVLSYYPRPLAIHDTFEQRRAVAQMSADSGEISLDEFNRIQISLENEERATYLEQSYLSKIGKTIQPIFAPAGFEWRTTVGVLAAFPARELVIPTLGILYNVGDVDPGAYDLSHLDTDTEGFRDRLRGSVRDDGSRAFNPLVALSVMIFFALCSQCVGTLAAIRRETRSLKWPVFVFSYMTLFAWLASVAVYQIGTMFSFGV